MSNQILDDFVEPPIIDLEEFLPKDLIKLRKSFVLFFVIGLILLFVVQNYYRSAWFDSYDDNNAYNNMGYYTRMTFFIFHYGVVVYLILPLLFTSLSFLRMYFIIWVYNYIIGMMLLLLFSSLIGAIFIGIIANVELAPFLTIKEGYRWFYLHYLSGITALVIMIWLLDKVYKHKMEYYNKRKKRSK